MAFGISTRNPKSANARCLDERLVGSRAGFGGESSDMAKHNAGAKMAEAIYARLYTRTEPETEPVPARIQV